MNKILFCTPAPLTKSLGAAKVVVELAEEMEHLGWQCRLLCPSDLDPSPDVLAARRRFPANLRDYLQDHAEEYDVVDYDHEYLPYPRSDFSPTPLFVARSVLLVHHLETIPIPSRDGLKSRVSALLKGRARATARQERIGRAQTTVEQADLVNVSNDDDKAELVRRGVDPAKIVVIPYGISRARRPLFDRVPSETPKQPRVAFVGTFDYRKGAWEFPRIVKVVAHAIPDVRFKMLGTKGFYQTEAEIRALFPQDAQKHLDMVLTYKPEELPELLSQCSLGVFPSYMEGFPFGVIEMLASSLPVVAYDAPGPPMMLSSEFLAARGDWPTLSKKIIGLLQNGEELARARQWAKERSQRFSWQKAAEVTQEAYFSFSR